MARQERYDTVRTTDDTEDDNGSLTEVEESLVGDEKTWSAEQFRRYSQHPTRKSSSLKCLLMSARWALDTVLLLIIIGLLVRDQWSKKAVGSRNDIGGDVTGFGPHFSTQVTKFHENSTFAPYNTSEFFRPEVYEAWNSLMPKGMGFQEINNTDHKYNDLPVPIQWGDPSKVIYTTSMTHQLHCVFIIAQTYSGITSNTTIPDDHHWHLIHCFDYLRQAIMCSADMSLEGLETTAPDHNGGSDGWDSKHVCKDYGQVIEYLESVRPYGYDGRTAD